MMGASRPGIFPMVMVNHVKNAWNIYITVILYLIYNQSDILLPRCRGPNITRPMYIPTQHRLLINSTMRPLIAPLEPPQSVPFILRHQHLLHLRIRIQLRARKVLDHARLVNESKDGGDGWWLAGHEGTTATDEDQDRGENHENDDGGGENGWGVEWLGCLGCYWEGGESDC